MRERDIWIERLLDLAEEGYLQIKHLEQVGLDTVLEGMQKNKEDIERRMSVRGEMRYGRVAERLGVAYIHKEQHIKAIQAFETGLDRKKVQFYAQVRLDTLVHRGEYEKAEELRDYLQERGLERKQPEEKRGWQGCCYKEELREFYD
jgi:hypothetical protein